MRDAVHAERRLGDGGFADRAPGEQVQVIMTGHAFGTPAQLGQGGSALEKEAESSLFQTIEQGIQRPADPKVLLDILGRRAEA
jgi:hypothetical protein